MKKFLKILLISLGSLIGFILALVLTLFLWISVSGKDKAKENLAGTTY